MSYRSAVCPMHTYPFIRIQGSSVTLSACCLVSVHLHFSLLQAYKELNSRLMLRDEQNNLNLSKSAPVQQENFLSNFLFFQFDILLSKAEFALWQFHIISALSTCLQIWAERVLDQKSEYIMRKSESKKIAALTSQLKP